MHLYRRKGSPYWWYRFRTPDGRTVRESSRCRDRRAAAKVGRERRQREEAAAAAAFAGEVQPADIALTDLASQWLASLIALGRKPSTVADYKRRTRLVLEEFGYETRARDIRPADVVHWVEKLGREDYAPQTVIHKLGTLRRILAHGVKRKLLAHNAAAGVEAPKLRKQSKFRALEPDEQAAFLAALRRPSSRPDDGGDQARRERLSWVVVFALETGLRLGELRAMQWQWIRQVEGQRPRLTLPVTATWSPKSGKTRVVPLSGVALEALDALAQGRDRIGPIYDVGQHRAAFHGAWEATGREGRCPSWHDFRHTCASRLAARGATLGELMAWFGWSGPQVAQRYLHQYGNVSERLEALIGGE